MKRLRAPPALENPRFGGTLPSLPQQIVSCERLTGGLFPLWEATPGRNPGVRHSIGDGIPVEMGGAALRPCGKWRRRGGPTWGQGPATREGGEGFRKWKRVHGGYPVRWADGRWVPSPKGDGPGVPRILTCHKLASLFFSMGQTSGRVGKAALTKK